MRSQRRWRCRECLREWCPPNAHSIGHSWAGTNCPACGSPEIEYVEFRGLFDINTPPEVSHGLEPLHDPTIYGGTVLNRGVMAGAEPFTPMALRGKE